MIERFDIFAIENDGGAVWLGTTDDERRTDGSIASGANEFPEISTTISATGPEDRQENIYNRRRDQLHSSASCRPLGKLGNRLESSQGRSCGKVHRADQSVVG